MSDPLFTKKRIDLTITLGTGSFGETVGETVTLTGLRAVADVVCAGGDYKSTLQLRVWGLPQQMMNQLTTIGLIQSALIAQNKIQVSAGDENGMSVLYEGAIIEAWAGYESAPDVPFNIFALAGIVQALKPVGAISYNSKSVDVGQIMSDIAKTMGLAFQNYGVSAQLSYPYFPGTAFAQAQKCAAAAHINFTIDRGTLKIWPGNAPVFTDAPPIISPETGLVGYPSFSSKTLGFRTVFNPTMNLPGNIQMKSSLPMANGIWTVIKLSHSVSSEMPGGPWFSEAICAPYGK